MAMDLVIEVDNRPGALAKIAAAISDAGVNLAAATCVGMGDRAELHILVPHAEAARHALAITHQAVISREREVVVVDVEDRPGALADLARTVAEAGVDLDLVYVATHNRVVFGSQGSRRLEGGTRQEALTSSRRHQMAAKRIIAVVGCHAEGEQGDVITGGVLPPPGDTMMAKKLAFERDHDDIRRLLICEPRGSVARHVNLIVPSTRDDCAAGAIIMEPTEYPPMSGSNTMCIATVLLETGVIPMVEPETRFRLDMPAGPVDIVAECRDGKCVIGDVEERAGVRVRARCAARSRRPRRVDHHRHRRMAG